MRDAETYFASSLGRELKPYERTLVNSVDDPDAAPALLNTFGKVWIRYQSRINTIVACEQATAFAREKLEEDLRSTIVTCGGPCDTSHNGGCGQRNCVRDLIYIQTMWYDCGGPYESGCWQDSEGQFECPCCHTRVRLYGSNAWIARLKPYFGGIVEETCAS